MKNNATKACLVAALALALAACYQEKPAESAGKKIDQAVEKVTQKVEQTADRAKDGAARAGQAIDDAAITAAVNAAILAEPGLKVLKIDVHTKDGTVTLTGSTESQDRVERATQIANSVEGVKFIDNRIAVSARG
jgi:hyperosmotically inducible periplasmic protein